MKQYRRGRRPIQEITGPQRRTLHEIRLFIIRHGFSPTIKELAEVLGISHASAHGQVNQLVRKGYLKRDSGKARGIAIVRKLDSDKEVTKLKGWLSNINPHFILVLLGKN